MTVSKKLILLSLFIASHSTKWLKSHFSQNIDNVIKEEQRNLGVTKICKVFLKAVFNFNFCFQILVNYLTKLLTRKKN